MRIAMVSEHASPLAVLGGVDAGGQNVHVAHLARSLADRGHTVDVYTRRDDPDLPLRVPLAPGVDVVHVTAGAVEEVPKDALLPVMEAFGEQLAAALLDAPADLLHAHFWMSGLATRAAATSLGLPFVQTFHALGSVKRRHQGSEDTSPPSRVATEAALAADADAVLATCRDEVAELEALGVPGGPSGRVHVVPCGVDTGHFTPDGPLGGPPRRARHRLVSVGRLVERKGVDTVVRALALGPAGPLADTELVVVGGPPAEHLVIDAEAVRLRDLAEDLGVADRLHLVGRVAHADLPALLRSADVVVATPWYEPFGIVPLEAMACGRPVVGSAVGGLLDTVAPGRTGALVPPRDPAALAAELGPLLGDPELLARWGAAARTRTVEHYGWDQVAAQTEAVYTGVLARTRMEAL